jgi:hypothetical protein
MEKKKFFPDDNSQRFGLLLQLSHRAPIFGRTMSTLYGEKKICSNYLIVRPFSAAQ